MALARLCDSSVRRSAARSLAELERTRKSVWPWATESPSWARTLATMPSRDVRTGSVPVMGTRGRETVLGVQPDHGRRAQDGGACRSATRKDIRCVERICEAADENPEAEFEIAWRIVDR